MALGSCRHSYRIGTNAAHHVTASALLRKIKIVNVCPQRTFYISSLSLCFDRYGNYSVHVIILPRTYICRIITRLCGYFFLLFVTFTSQK